MIDRFSMNEAEVAEDWRRIGEGLKEDWGRVGAGCAHRKSRDVQHNCDRVSKDDR